MVAQSKVSDTNVAFVQTLISVRNVKLRNHILIHSWRSENLNNLQTTLCAHILPNNNSNPWDNLRWDNHRSTRRMQTKRSFTMQDSLKRHLVKSTRLDQVKCSARLGLSEMKVKLHGHKILPWLTPMAMIWRQLAKLSLKQLILVMKSIFVWKWKLHS